MVLRGRHACKPSVWFHQMLTEDRNGKGSYIRSWKCKVNVLYTTFAKDLV